MKIGILTYHRTNNYGACLQAVATRLFLEQMGHEACYVDYWPQYHADTYKVFALSNLKRYNFKGKIGYLFSAFSNLSEKRERINNFNKFLSVYILPYCKPTTEQFDAILYGSDQIWRKQSALKDYNPVYFGKNDFSTRNHIAFAASMGNLPKKEADKEKIRGLVSHFNHIAVREENLRKLLFSIGVENVERIVDPTILLTGDDWANKLNIPKYTGKPYILIYAVTKPAFDMKQIEKFASDRNLEIKILSGSAKSSNNKNVYSTADPLQFLSLIYNAQYTFVSSFHGLAFSILFHREVYASYFKNSNRAETLLDTIGLRSRLLEPMTILKEQPHIDYDSVDQILLKERSRVSTLLNMYLNE